jgi:hypothetical protein
MLKVWLNAIFPLFLNCLLDLTPSTHGRCCPLHTPVHRYMPCTLSYPRSCIWGFFCLTQHLTGCRIRKCLSVIFISDKDERNIRIFIPAGDIGNIYIYIYIYYYSFIPTLSPYGTASTCMILSVQTWTIGTWHEESCSTEHSPLYTNAV